MFSKLQMKVIEPGFGGITSLISIFGVQMKEKKYNKECAENVIQSLGLDVKKIDKCTGDPNADAENPVLKQEQDAQVGH